MPPRIAEIWGLIGPKGCGKTWRGKQLIHRERLAILVDTAREFSGTIDPVYTVDELVHHMRNRDRRKKTHISFRAGERIDPQMAFEYAAAVAMADPNERCLVFANETGRLIPRAGKLSKIAYKIVTMGRHYNAPLMWTAQKVTGVHPDLRQNADFMDIFRSQEFTTLEHIKKMGGPQALEQFQTLEKYEFLQFAPGKAPKKMKKTKKA